MLVGNNKKMISVIMPVYNSEKYVSESIESVCNQSYENRELLIVNDVSTDHTSKTIDDYAKKDSRIQVFHKKMKGFYSKKFCVISDIWRICYIYRQ